MLSIKSLYTSFLEEKKKKNPAISSIAFQLLAMEPFLEGCFTDKELNTLIIESMFIPQEKKVEIAQEAFSKAQDESLCLSDKIYYLFIATSVAAYLKDVLDSTSIIQTLEMIEEKASLSFMQLTNTTNQSYLCY